MRVVHLSFSDRLGGAARSAHRLHVGLLSAGCDSRMLVVAAAAADENVIEVGTRSESDEVSLIERYYCTLNRSDLSNTHFSLHRGGFELLEHPVIESAEIVNLHWVAGMVTPREIRELVAAGKRVVWTLHDQRAFTGGCHFSAGCSGYEVDCRDCPQLADDPCDLPAEQLADSVRELADLDIAWVTPSKWLSNCLRASSLARGRSVATIPYGLDTSVFHPVDQQEAIAALGLESGVSYVCVGAHDLNERRKGSESMLEVLGAMATRPEFAEKVASGEWRVLAFGRDCGTIDYRGWQAATFAYVDSDEKLAQLYSAASVLLFTSHEDNLPNTILEAMSCGCPVVASLVGGTVDLIEPGVTGQLVRDGDIDGMATTLGEVLSDELMQDQLGRASRRRAEERFGLGSQAARYVKLYEGLAPAAAISDSSRQEPEKEKEELLRQSLVVADRELRRFEDDTVKTYEAKFAWLEGEVEFWKRRTVGHWLRTASASVKNSRDGLFRLVRRGPRSER